MSTVRSGPGGELVHRGADAIASAGSGAVILLLLLQESVEVVRTEPGVEEHLAVVFVKPAPQLRVDRNLRWEIHGQRVPASQGNVDDRRVLDSSPPTRLRQVLVRDDVDWVVACRKRLALEHRQQPRTIEERL